jgi:DNA-directed RNA polymerase subunit RPC12/RpoP
MDGELVECPSCGYLMDQVTRQAQQQTTAKTSAQHSRPYSSKSAIKETKPCPFCGEPILAIAIKCKHCGSDLIAKGKGKPAAPQKQKTSSIAQGCGVKDPPIAVNQNGFLITLIVVVILGIWGYRSCSSMFELSPEAKVKLNAERQQEKRYGSKSMAYIMSQDFVKKQLKSPSSAKFPWYDDSFVSDLGEGRYIVSAHVDAQNAFGAMLQSRYICTLKYTGNDVWTCENVNILN